ncbi:MAG: alpha-L-fucosidase [Agriterribacter sp.]
MARKTLLLTALFVTILGQAHLLYAQKKVDLQHGAHRIGKRTDAEMERWRGYGLGQFIHWGVYSILGGKYNGEPYQGAAEWIRAWNKLPNAVYDSLYTQFNPTEYKPQQWALMAKQMGVKYLTFTTKHHDGFCLWPSQYTSYSINNTPYKKDVIRPLIDAYTKAGIDVYLYFSIMDWSHPDWRYDLKTKDDTLAFDRFKEFTKNQLTELLTLYPETKGLWFDGTWDNSWKKNGAFTDSLEQYLKELRPGLIIGSRLRADELGNRHKDKNGFLMGDYEQGWERKIPETIERVDGNDWDCVMTIPENGWGYQEKWLGHWKTSYELIEMMVQCVSLSGNLVINFGPKGDGSFRSEETIIAKEIGNWMDVNKEAIYNCEYSGWEKQDWGYYTKKRNSNKLYMVVLNIPLSKQLKVQPPKGWSVGKAQLLQNKKNLEKENIDNNGYYIRLPEVVSFKYPFVIEIDIQKNQTASKEQKAKT